MKKIVRKKLLKISKAKKLGMSLMEIIIAIAISSITLTVSAIFSTQLTFKAQENFMAESSAQYQNLIAQQFRLLESDMITLKKKNAIGGTKVQPMAFPAKFTGLNPWRTMCTLGTASPIHYSITLPKVVDPNQTIDIKLNQVTSVAVSEQYTENGKLFYFVPIPQKEQLTGAFAQLATTNRTVFIAIRKTEPNSGIAGVPNPILFEIRLRYSVLNRSTPAYSKVTEVQMVKDLVCPTNNNDYPASAP